MFDSKIIFNVAAGVALVVLAYWAYNKYVASPTLPTAATS